MLCLYSVVRLYRYSEINPMQFKYIQSSLSTLFNITSIQRSKMICVHIIRCFEYVGYDIFACNNAVKL